MNFLSSLSFGAPWILAARIVLPAIWFLLRVTPPAPRNVVFPPLRLLLGLRDEEETPARTPWWLLLLRLIAAALLIVALAGPLIGASPQLQGSGPLVLMVDNGWTAAPGWSKRQTVMDDLLRRAADAGRPVAIVPTADTPDVSLMDAAKAQRMARELAPRIWQPDQMRATAAIVKANFPATPEIIWLSDGLEHGSAASVAERLRNKGPTSITIDAGNSARAVLPPVADNNGFAVTVIRAGNNGGDGQVAAMNGRGGMLATAPFHFEAGSDKAVAHLRLPPQVRSDTARIAIQNEESAGALQLLNGGGLRKTMGLVSAGSTEDQQPLLSDVFYLERALSPYADLRKGSIADLLNSKVGVLVLADIGRVAGADHERVLQFVRDGGLLIRFAGQRMANDADDLVPVRLRSGGRYLGGAMGWATPQKLAPFNTESPFSGLNIPDDVTVSRQILAEPGIALSDSAWARLSDGTPLVTAQQRGKGWIVLFHITAGPNWSTLPLSGLYVDMLRRVLTLASGTRPESLGTQTNLAPLETLDGFGRLQQPPGDALPLRGDAMSKTEVSPRHPPGLYGKPGSEVAFNAVKADAMLLPLRRLNLPVRAYEDTRTIALAPLLLTLAMGILLADAVLSLWLRGHIRLSRKVVTRSAAALLAVLFMRPDHARADDAFALYSALDTRLAYVETGLDDVDSISKAGLTGLGRAVGARTSYEPKEPVGVNIEKDDLAFFPLLYWPMDPRESDLSPQALSKISNYMRNGGTILFDTRDLTLGAVRGANSAGEQTLRRLLSKLDVPPLQPLPQDHVLTRAFYLLKEFPGRWDGGQIWVEALPPPDPNAGPVAARGGDGVSPLIIGGNDFAAAWAVDAQGRPLMDVVPGGEVQREMALRFGVNIVMYTLTGNYKTDQVHVPSLLRKLGK
jgi:hypothetical protein